MQAGRVVAITGAAGGIGRAMAAAFARAGDRVAGLDLDTIADLDGLAIQTDVTDPAACERAVAEVTERWGGIDVLVLNAGITHRSLFADTEVDVIRQVMDVNFFGAVNCAHAALPSLIARRGHLVVISSVAGFAPLTGRTGYAASKHALHGFFDTLRVELKPTGVAVTVVCPSFVDTALRTGALGPDGTPRGRDPGGVGRLITPEALATAIVQATHTRQRQLLVSPVARLAWWVSRFSPRAYAHLMHRTQRQAIER